ncbi:hypothetical protein ILUMI_01451 [Ignelater luminosus]|uniref:Odorant receptor n=1 Tax=Ignelater luminosus TaxID=2038154 RepID=A0A8K0GLQ4_IGNLU|nr:hypothetical protein ILUMI_01451 [Ignelater luminosus]
MANKDIKMNTDIGEIHPSTNEIPEALKQPFAGIQKFGLLSSNRFIKIVTISLGGLTVIAYVAIISLQFVNIKREISKYVNNLEVMFGGLQLLARIVTLAFWEEDFMELFNERKLFWSANECDKSTRTEVTSIHNLTLHLQKSFLFVTILAIIFALISPIFGSSLPLGVWTLKGHDVLYGFTLVLSQFLTPAAGIFACSYDCIYLAFAAEIVIQFKILSHYLQHLTENDGSLLEREKNYTGKLKKYYYRYIFLLRFVNKFQSFYSTMLFIEYITICPLICLEMYATTESSSMQLNARYIIMGGMVTMQLIFYCIPANYISDEALTISSAVYFSDWHSHYFPSATKPILLMIQNSQREISIKAGGLITMDARTVVNVLKVAWSACSVIRGLK